MEPFYPLHALVCEACLLVQVETVEAPEHIFSDYAYFSSYSGAMVTQAKDYAGAVTERFRLNRTSLVIEIASNDGYLLQHFVEQGIPVLGIEPAANVAAASRAKNIPTLVRFFGVAAADELAREDRRADLMVANNVVAHVPDINDFVSGFPQLLKPAGVVTFEFHHVLQLIRHNQFDSIYHEHFCYHSLTTFRQILERNGLGVFDVEEVPTHGGSLRVYAQHLGGPHQVCDRVAAMLENEQAAGLTRLETYVAFAARVREIKRELLSFFLDAASEGKSIVGYGAPAKANTLLNYAGVGSDFIEYTVDRSPHKQGRFLPGTHIPIHAPERIRETKPDYVLILAWNLKDEVIQQMADVRDWGGRFVVLIPEVQVL
jgi:SAM-dependent methyltransferase